MRQIRRFVKKQAFILIGGAVISVIGLLTIGSVIPPAKRNKTLVAANEHAAHEQTHIRQFMKVTRCSFIDLLCKWGLRANKFMCV